MSDAPVSLRCSQILPSGTRMISTNVGFGPPFMFEVAEPDTTMVVEPVGCCKAPVPTGKPGGFPSPFCPGAQDVIFTVAEKGLPQVETWEMFGTDEGWGTVWLVGWIPSWERSHNIP